jgi:hypothetical protein
MDIYNAAFIVATTVASNVASSILKYFVRRPQPLPVLHAVAIGVAS